MTDKPALLDCLNREAQNPAETSVLSSPEATIPDLDLGDSIQTGPVCSLRALGCLLQSWSLLLLSLPWNEGYNDAAIRGQWALLSIRTCDAFRSLWCRWLWFAGGRQSEAYCEEQGKTEWNEAQWSFMSHTNAHTSSSNHSAKIFSQRNGIK